ncbi:hypothetical protein PAXRUDRAFT_836041 [Paxillus rubicundulus Ve08.2h10]|uniref:Unplaced genomic scaffold scaffold_4275, whole genome shotgun sequence n=1 Tax=Paxillus rubicundulus Ve08.2h10 TaxID=930991 RepID=A0A0D0DAD4_9AGAM|nr:hypothetical protein PAXRUDRAFT_836041 [Paxillus rubicundulus Ve08.2h10]
MLAREDSHRWTRLRREQSGWQQTWRRLDERCVDKARQIDSHLFRGSVCSLVFTCGTRGQRLSGMRISHLAPLESEQGPYERIVNWRATC